MFSGCYIQLVEYFFFVLGDMLGGCVCRECYVKSVECVLSA